MVTGFIKDAQTLFPSDNPYYNIVELIQHLIMLYFDQMFESKSLNDDEKDKLLQLLHADDKYIANCSWELIYESQKDALTMDIFIDKVYNIPNVLLLIKTDDDTIFGGYTKTGWIESMKDNQGWIPDKDAFVFYLQSPKYYQPFISNVITIYLTNVHIVYQIRLIHGPKNWQNTP